MKYLLIASLFFVTACAGNGDPETVVFQTRTGYTSLLVAAVQYESLPRCPETTDKLCSDPGIVEILRKADDTAKAALDAAENTVRNHPEIDADFAVAAAQNAVEALRVILTTYNLMGQ